MCLPISDINVPFTLNFLKHHIEYILNSLTGETFKDYLGFLSEYFQHQPIHLILDIFSVYRSPEIKEYAPAWNHSSLHSSWMHRQISTTGSTRFRCFKGYGPTCILFYAQYRENPEFQFSKQNAIEALVYSWEHLSIDVIEDA